MKPIFIHSLFRTGSTYIWSKFRESDRYHCFYEPLHQSLARVTEENLDSILTNDFEVVNHPHLSTSYWVEYRDLLEKDRVGLPFFKKTFSFDEYCVIENNQPLKRYIDFLLKGAESRQPLLQFNRSTFRTRWFKTNYPESLNIYLVRHPRDQWRSYHELFKRTGFDVFFIQELLIASTNSCHQPFRPLAQHLPLFEFFDENFEREVEFYRAIYDGYTSCENYLIYYFIWFRALMENVLTSDILININLTSKDREYRNKLYRTLENYGISNVNFDDASVRTYDSSNVHGFDFDTLEDRVQRMVLHSFRMEDIESIFTKMDPVECEYFGFDKADFIAKYNGKSVRPLPGPQRIKKLEQILGRLAVHFAQHTKEIENLKRILNWKDHEKKEREQILHEKEAFIKRVNNEISGKDNIIKTKEQKLKDQIVKIEEIDRLLTNKNTELRHQERILAEKEYELNYQEKVLAEKEEKLKEADHRLSEKEIEIEELKKEISEMEDKMREILHSYTKKEKELLDMQRELAEKEKRGHQIDRRLAQKEKEILNLELSQKEKDDHIDMLSFQLHKQLEKIYDLRNQSSGQIGNLQQEFDLLSARYEKMLNSYTYRIGNIITGPAKLVKRVIRDNTGAKKRGYTPHPPAQPFRTAKPLPLVQPQLGNHVGTDFTQQKKVNLEEQLSALFGTHRSGWSFVVKHMEVLHNPKGILFDTFIERTFTWHPKGIRPHREPWIGFIHVPPKVPEWFHHEQSNEILFRSRAWQESLPHCQGLFTLSEYHKKFLDNILDIPVNNLLFATEFVQQKWDRQKFLGNNEKKIVQIGWWLRKLHAIYQFPKTMYKKVFLNAGHNSIKELMKAEREILIKEGTFADHMYDTAETHSFLPNDQYDRLLCENIAFVYLYDASANNTVIECISRNTPLLINPLEPVREYLGDDYPFYYNSLEEAAEKAVDLDLVCRTNQYLINLPIKAKLSIEHFLQSLVESEIFRSIPPLN